MHPQIRENISLKEYNTFGITARARYLAKFQAAAELKTLLQDAHLPSSATPLVLGGGSNVLFTRDFDGLVLVNEIHGIEVIQEDANHVYVKVGAGVNWHAFVLYCLERNYAGVENLALIPGSVGASPMQNIGAYGVELKDVFFELEAFHLRDWNHQVFNSAECAFGYRESVFKHGYKDSFAITSVTYRLNKTPDFHTEYGAIRDELQRMNVTELTIQAIASAVIRIRRSKLPDPKELGNAGSFFKNPFVALAQFQDLQTAHAGIVGFPQPGGVKLAAGWLIENCGWKGFRRGDAGCYEKQALVLVNYGNARGADILKLSEEIIQSVQQRFGVQLEREVNLV